jgi:hypothetical protein
LFRVIWRGILKATPMNTLSHSMREKKTFRMVPYQIILADDHVLLLRGLKRLMEEMGKPAMAGSFLIS